MKKFEIHLPVKLHHGNPTEDATVGVFRGTLRRAFVVYDHLKRQGEGNWDIAGITFRDDVTIVHVIATKLPNLDTDDFRKLSEATLASQDVLLLESDVGSHSCLRMDADCDDWARRSQVDAAPARVACDARA